MSRHPRRARASKGANSIQQGFAMRTCGFNSRRIDEPQQVERNPALAVGLLALCSRPLERFQDRCLRDSLKLRPCSERSRRKLLTKVAMHCELIGKEPSLHALHHQKRLVVARVPWPMPTIGGSKVFPDCLVRCDRAFAVQKEQRDCRMGRIRDGQAKPLESLSTPAAPHDTRQSRNTCRSE